MHGQVVAILGVVVVHPQLRCQLVAPVGTSMEPPFFAVSCVPLVVDRRAFDTSK